MKYIGVKKLIATLFGNSLNATFLEVECLPFILIQMASVPITNITSNKYHYFPKDLYNTPQYSQLLLN